MRHFLESIERALNLPSLQINNEVKIKHIRSDIAVIIMNTTIVGVIHFKKPGENVLLEPTVLGELMEQMLLMEGFYGMGPAIGILTTGEEWLFFWFPTDFSIDDIAHLSEVNPIESLEDSFASASSALTGVKRHSEIHFIDMVTDDASFVEHIDESSEVCNNNDIKIDISIDVDIDIDLNRDVQRLLHTTEVMNIHRDRIRVLQHLCGALQLMAKTESSYHMSKHHNHNDNHNHNHIGTLPRCVIKFHKRIETVTYHEASVDSVLAMVDFNKFPSNNTKTLVALDDLGRGATGKAWLCATVTKPRSASCVLKFDNKRSGNSANLTKEKEMWHLLYPEFKDMVSLDIWSGSQALMMPHFATILESERDQYRDKLIQVLTMKFMNKGKVHRDVRWRNIGKYRQQNGEETVVVYDLHSVVDYNVDAHINWIDNAVNALFEKTSNY